MKKQKAKEKKASTATKKDELSPADSEEPTGPTRIENEDPNKKSTETADQAEPEAGAEQKDEVAENWPSEKEPASSSQPSRDRQPSLSLQSKLRSSSFRRSSITQTPHSPNANGAKSPELPILSADGESVNSIYRKQAARLEEMEKDNKRLGKEAQENEHKWRQTEEELEELREASADVAELKSKAKRVDAQTEEVKKLRSEITSLERQNSQLHSQSSKRHVSSPSQANSAPGSLQAQLDSKSSAVESMEMEISTLRAQLEKSSQSSSGHTEQVSALEEKLDRAERAATASQRELQDVKRSLARASEKAVKDGSEKTSAETKIRVLAREADDARRAADEYLKRIDTLEKKLVALTNMHKEADSRRQAGDRQREMLDSEAGKMHRRLASLENDNLRLRDERERARKREISGPVDDDGVDELEDEERRRLESKIHGLESEVHELRKGMWREKRRELGGGADGGADGLNSPGAKFDDVDLTGGASPFRRQSLAGRGSSFSNVLSSGFNAFTGGQGRQSDDLMDGPDDFDEDAFRIAQEEEAKKQIERVKEIKRGLKEWEGWRMDIVDVRISGGGAGNIFDV